jgi:hypothetical protein
MDYSTEVVGKINSRDTARQSIHEVNCRNSSSTVVEVLRKTWKFIRIWLQKISKIL